MNAQLNIVATFYVPQLKTFDIYLPDPDLLTGNAAFRRQYVRHSTACVSYRAHSTRCLCQTLDEASSRPPPAAPAAARRCTEGPVRQR